MTAQILEINKKSKAHRIKNPVSKRLYTIPQAGEYLGRSTYSVRTLIWNGQLRIVKNGKKMWLDVMDMDAWIERNKIKYE